MDDNELRIDPWASTQYEDYAKLRDQFGIKPFDTDCLPDPPKLFRRGIVFGHRGFEYIQDAIDQKLPWAILTGLMPSGKMHLGHKTLIDQIVYYQTLGADIFIAVADIESFATRNIPLDKAREVAINEYITTYIALGLKPEKTQLYFQSGRGAVKDLGYLLSRKVNWSTMKAIYGFDDSTSMAHVQAPLVQVGDILHVQLEKYGGPRPTLVPVGVDQDPHMRITRDIATAHRLFNVRVTKDGKLGAFVKVDEGVEELLDLAEIAFKNIGLTKLEKNVGYKALYVGDKFEEDWMLENTMRKMDRELVQIEFKRNPYVFYPPASTYHRFLSNLTMDKMSSSRPDSAVFITDDPDLAAKKVMSAKTGGGISLEDHKTNGGKPGQCVVYELFTYHLIEDDMELQGIMEGCKAGTQMCGNCKKLAAEKVKTLLIDLQEKRAAAKELVGQYLVED